MKELVEYFKKKGLIFRELKALDPGRLGIKKRWKIYEGVDTKNRYVLIVEIERKSRFLRKDAQSLLEVQELLEKSLGHGFKKRYLLLKAPLCSKAKELLQSAGWSVDAAV